MPFPRGRLNGPHGVITGWDGNLATAEATVRTTLAKLMQSQMPNVTPAGPITYWGSIDENGNPILLFDTE